MPSRTVLLSALLAFAPSLAALEPLVYTIRVSDPVHHQAEVRAHIPTEGREKLDLMMATWSPGYYAIQDYAADVKDLEAATTDGRPLAVERPAPNRWRVRTDGAAAFTLSYRLDCRVRFVTTNWIDGDLAVLNGPATFVTLAETARRPQEVRLELPAAWKDSATGLEAAPDGAPHHYVAPDFDTLADSPLVAGTFSIHATQVAGTRSILVDMGTFGTWDGARGSLDLAGLMRENLRFWGELPFRKYVFLNAFGAGPGGLEHANSTLLSAAKPGPGSGRAGFGWYSYVSHELFHAYNVKRLRPVELGPFDYEHPPRTAGLWVAEGLTTYYGPLIAVRAGLGGPGDFLDELSAKIRSLQRTPGRKFQTLEQSSLEVWEEGGSGVGGNPERGVSYYVKGPVVGFLLDARIRAATGGRKSLDDVMRLAYARYGGPRGFTGAQFRRVTEEVAGCGLEAWFRKHLASTEELDYSEALGWFGLRFAASPGEAEASWQLEVDPEAGPDGKRRFEALVGAKGVSPLR